MGPAVFRSAKQEIIEVKRNSVIFLIALFLFVPAVSEAENVYRWKDADGKVHFGRTLPPEYAHKPHEILNSAGVVIERIDDPVAAQQPKPVEVEEEKGLEPLFTEDEVRLRSDRLLLLRYPEEEDLQKAMQNEIDQLSYDIRLNTQSQAGTMTALVGQVKVAADRQRGGLAEEPELSSKINKLRRDLRAIDRRLAAIAVRENEIRAAFGKDLGRYQYLREGGQEGALITE